MRKRIPDLAKAKSLVDASEQEMKYIDSLQPVKEAGSTIIRGIYENFRRLGEAVLISQGFGFNHEECIAALINLNPKTQRPIQALSNLGRLRHDINYNGFIPSEADITDVLSIKDSCWKPVLNEVKRLLAQKEKGN